MKLLIDFQACQGQSRNRGIGRYAFGLLKGMAKAGHLSDAALHVNATLGGMEDSMLQEILAISPQTQVVAEKYLPMEGKNREQNRELNVVQFSNIASNYDGVLFLDPMEVGWTNFVPESRVSLPSHVWCGAVIYDFIPLIFKNVYLLKPANSLVYHRKLQLVRMCDCLLSISEHTKKDAINLLGIFSSKLTNISAGIDPMFTHTECSADDLRSLGIEKEFIIHLGGMDFRKNMIGGMRAFGLLPADLKKRLQLVVVCEGNSNMERRLREEVFKEGVSEKDVVFTGYVPDETLLKLYSAAALSIFPSLYEGFGFPIGEAIKCNTPVLAGDNSSLPEVAGTEDALFDSASPKSIADKIEYALKNPDWLKDILARQRANVEKFTWERSANTAWSTIEASYTEFKEERRHKSYRHFSRPKLAWFIPMTMQYYNASLIPLLSQNFDIDLVIGDDCSLDDGYLAANYLSLSSAEFEAKYQTGVYDQCVYHIGNSRYHTYMFPFIEKYGGAMVLHEVIMDGLARILASWIAYTSELQLNQWQLCASDEESVRMKAVNFLQSILKFSDGVLVHSAYAKEMLFDMIPQVLCPVVVSEHGTSLPVPLTPEEKRRLKQKLAIDEGKIVCSAVGYVQWHKGLDDIFEALSRSRIAQNIIFNLVGGCLGNSEWVEALLAKFAPAGIDVRMTGYVDDESLFGYINVSDFAFALRVSAPRGESSGALAHLLSRGVPTIVYDVGSFAEIDDAAVLKTPPSDIEALKNNFERLAKSEELRKTISAHARDVAARWHWSTRVGSYSDFIYQSIEYKKNIQRHATNASDEMLQRLRKPLSY